jgi:predicted Zn-dependent peptidase
MSHFVEHMVFKGSQRLGPGDFDREIEGRGGVANAATGQDYTHFFLTVASRDLAATLPYLADAIANPLFLADEFERERQVVFEEMRRAEDDPDVRAYNLLVQTAYGNHSYCRPVLGTAASLLELTPEMMRMYHQQWYRPEQMAVVVVGNIEADATLESIHQCFGHLSPADRLTALPRVWEERSLRDVKRVVEEEPQLEQARLILAWPGVSVAEWEIACGLDLLTAILGEGHSSRLVQLLREQRGWVRGIGCSSAVQLEAGLISASAYLDPQWLPAVESAILVEIERLHDEPPSGEELERARRMLVNEFVFATESPSQLARAYGFYHLIGGVDLAQRYLDKLSSITPEDLQTLARRYLTTDRYFVTVLRPTSFPLPAIAA